MEEEITKKELLYWARLLNERGLVTARSGNISAKTSGGSLLITAHDAYLGQLAEDDIIVIDPEGNRIFGEKDPTSEKELHCAVHNAFPGLQVLLHSHSPFTTAFFYYCKKLDIYSYEAKFYLGNIPVVEQKTPTVTKIEPVIEALKVSNVIVLRGHGVVATGVSFKDAFGLIELLEEQAKVGLIVKGRSPGHAQDTPSSAPRKNSARRRYKLLSKEHIDALVAVINTDEKAQRLGTQYGLTCTLAVKDQDTGAAACFYYEQGKIVKTDNSTEAEFIITGGSGILKRVFNRELDPFVASTQGKVKTKGDFAKMSKWYPVLVRTFELWEEAPVE